MQVIIRILADYMLIPIVLVASYALLFHVKKQGRYYIYTRILMAGVSSYFLAKVIGNLWQPEKLRPFEIQGVTPGASFIGNAGFPSDHVLLAVFLTLAVWHGTHKKWLTLTMAILTVLLAVGRVLALVHSVLDVFGSLVIALVGALWYLGEKKMIRTYKTSKKIKEVV